MSSLKNKAELAAWVLRRGGVAGKRRVLGEHVLPKGTGFTSFLILEIILGCVTVKFHLDFNQNIEQLSPRERGPLQSLS